MSTHEGQPVPEEVCNCATCQRLAALPAVEAPVPPAVTPDLVQVAPVVEIPVPPAPELKPEPHVHVDGRKLAITAYEVNLQRALAPRW
jgi:hypothetical protein